MCFKSPDIPKPKPLPATPTPDSDAVRNRERTEEELLRQTAGRASTVVSDLRPGDITGQKKVLLGN